MVNPNWGLLFANGGNGGFDNALARGMQIGSRIRERREQEAQRNAFAEYAANPTREGAAGLVQYNPQFGMGEIARFDQQAQQQQQSGIEGLDKFRPLLQQAMESPEGWAQALSAAQAAGMDVSRVPQQYDPEWARGQLMIVDALRSQEGQQALSTAGKQAMDMGLRPGTPEFATTVTELVTASLAQPYTGSQGETRLYRPQIGAQAPAAPQVGAIEDGYRFLGGDPANPNSWQQVGAQEMSAPQMTVSPRELDALVRQFGPEEVQRRLDAGIVAVRN